MMQLEIQAKANEERRKADEDFREERRKNDLERDDRLRKEAGEREKDNRKIDLGYKELEKEMRSLDMGERARQWSASFLWVKRGIGLSVCVGLLSVIVSGYSVFKKQETPVNNIYITAPSAPQPPK